MNIYKENKMTYDIPESLTLVKKRTQIIAPFDEEIFENVRGGEVLRCSWNTGEYMVATKTSFLVVTISVKEINESPYNFGTGGVMSIFRDIIIRSKSGVELCRMNDPKLWNKLKFRFDTEADRVKSVGEIMGFVEDVANDSVGVAYETPSPTAIQKYKFAIPLDFLSPMFTAVDGSQFLPSQIAEGLTFEFYPADKDNIFKTLQPVLEYNIHEIKFRLDGVILNDRSLMELNNKCHKKGLEWTCAGVYKQDIKNTPGDSDVQNQINYSVSQALKADTIYQLSNRTDSQANDKSAFLYTPREFQYRSGSDYFPQSRIRDDGPKLSETYVQSFYTHPLMKLSLGEFSSNNVIYSANLNLDDNLDLSGIIVNNSKTLEYLSVGKPGFEFSVDVSTLLHYVKVIKIVGTNVSVAT